MRNYPQGVTSLEMINVCGENKESANLRAADISDLVPVKGEERKAKASTKTKQRE
jgi:hypothetical protein